MHLVLTAVLPIVLLLAMGNLTRRRFVPEPGFWRGLERLTYFVFTPALFISSIPGTDLSVIPLGPLLVSLVVPTLLVTLLVFGLRRVLRWDGPALTSMVQGSIRLNTYVGLVFATALHGDDGVATFAIAAAVMVPLVNVISVLSLSVYADAASGRGLWRELVENPLILGCAAGLALNLLSVELPSFLAVTVQMLAQPALVCGTLVAGAAISFRFSRRDVVDIGAASVLKLVLLPGLALGLAVALDVRGATLASIAIICALPTAPSAYVLAARMGGDTRLIASITGAQTVLALVTLPVVLALI